MLFFSITICCRITCFPYRISYCGITVRAMQSFFFVIVVAFVVVFLFPLSLRATTAGGISTQTISNSTAITNSKTRWYVCYIRAKCIHGPFPGIATTGIYYPTTPDPSITLKNDKWRRWFLTFSAYNSSFFSLSLLFPFFVRSFCCYKRRYSIYLRRKHIPCLWVRFAGPFTNKLLATSCFGVQCAQAIHGT